jgi:CRISPR-associated exonuclease Cas4
MKTKSYSLPVSILRQFCFCPRIPFFNEVMGVYSESPLWVQQGVDEHIRQTMLEKRRNLTRFGLTNGESHFSVELKSDILGLHGIADMLISTETSIYVVEFKPNTEFIQHSHILQAVAYGMIAEEVFQKTLSGVYILYGNRGQIKSIKGIDKYKQETIRTIDRLHKTVQSLSLPHSDSHSNKCAQCEYINFCNDRNIEYEYI